MAKYTTEVRSICEVLAGKTESEGYMSVNDIIANSRQAIFNFSYPLFDDNYRAVLETKILKHYYGREIGAETFGRWQLWLDAKMNEIMPYYNKLYESELLEFNPLHDVDLTITRNKEGQSNTDFEGTEQEARNNTRTDNLTRTENLTQTDDYTRTDNLSRDLERTRTDNLTKTTQDSGTEGETGSTVDKNTRWDIYSDTPQGSLQNVENETYLTNARKIIDDGTGSTNSKTTTFGKRVTENDTGTIATDETETNTGTQRNNGTSTNTGTETNTGTQTNAETGNVSNTSSTDVTSTEDYLEHIVGKNYGKSFSELLLAYRETLLNIDLQVINELSDLFMGLW